MSTTIDPSLTLGEIVTRQPSLAVVLERHGLDYCCHGSRTLDAAAAEAGLDPQTVVDDLATATDDTPGPDWSSFGPTELVDHIEAEHHTYLWEQMPRLTGLIAKIVEVHGDRHPELAEVQRLYTALRDDLEPHLRREEDDIFPAIRSAGANTDPRAVDEQLGAQLDEMGDDHEVVGALLEDLRRVTSGYTTPADGCATYLATYETLAGIEADLHLHVHKENNVLIPALRGAAG